MLRSLKTLQHSSVDARDGAVGTVSRFLVDLDHWVVRYLVVETGDWWPDREVLISPMSLRSGGEGARDHLLGLSLTRTEIRQSPEYDRGSVSLGAHAGGHGSRAGRTQRIVRSTRR